MRSLLSVDQEQLFNTFLEYDIDLSGRMDREEFMNMLRAFDPSQDPRDLEAFLNEIDEDCDGDISFTEFLDWWEMKKDDASGAGTGWFSMQLKMKFAGDKLKGFMGGKDQLDERLQRMSDAELQQCIHRYREDLYLLRLWMHEMRTKAEDEMEAQNLRKAKGVIWTEEERSDLKDLFLRVSRGKETIGVESSLPRLCALLNFDITFSCLERITKLYSTRMDFENFLIFWATRPESGKLSFVGRPPVYRWGEANPTGSGISKPIFS